MLNIKSIVVPTQRFGIKLLFKTVDGFRGPPATVPDRRKFHEYSMASILTQGIFMFLCQGNSRNQMNNMAAFGSDVKENFMRLFPEMRGTHFDSIDWCLRGIKMREIEEVKA